MKVLVVYQNIPESTNLHIIDAEGRDLEILKNCHGCFVNSGELSEEQEAATSALNFYLSPLEYIDADFAESVGLSIEEGGKWADTKIDDSEEPVDVSEQGIEIVISTGFLM